MPISWEEERVLPRCDCVGSVCDAMHQHVIAHHFDARITGLLRDRWPQFAVLQVDAARSWQLPPETSVLLSGPSTVWSGAGHA
jgi:hypothetical protein